MSYQVLARKWRPRTFQELVGQEHVVRALVNALDNDRLHHAFLFTGTRGVGKTTIARILAKALNCEQGVSSIPCGVCAACREIDEGRFVDLIEVDAASRTGVDDTRELLDNVPYAPARGRYKVYLIDEVHMFSRSSFNALLKTLEEPPPHVKFLLATTDPQKLPVTVLSRCLQFNLRRLSPVLISQHLDAVLEREGVAREPAALTLLAQAGDGSVRDALSLLDQAIAFGGGRVALEDVRNMLGAIDQRHVVELLEALAAGDPGAVLQRVADLDRAAPDYQAVLADLISLLQRLALAQVVPGAADDSGLADAETVRRLAAALTPEETQLFYQIALIGRRDLPLSPEPRGGFEMILLRMLCFRPVTEMSSRQTSVPSAPGAGLAPPVTAPPVTASPVTAPAAFPAAGGSPASEWSGIVAALALSGRVKQLAMNCALLGREGDVIRLQLAPGHELLRAGQAEERLRLALEKHYGQPVRLHFQAGDSDAASPARQQAEQQAARREAAAASLTSDPNVQALCETFNARIRPESITPVDD